MEDQLDPEVLALAVLGDTVYVGGAFSAIGGQPRRDFAAVDATTGSATNWNPDVDDRVGSLVASGNTIYAGGRFTRLGGLPCAGLAAISGSDKPSVSPRTLVLAQSYPNPVRADATIRFALPASSPATLAVYDVQGRRVATVLDHERRPAGPQAVSVNVSTWPVGCYLYRLEAGGSSATRKMLVIK